MPKKSMYRSLACLLPLTTATSLYAGNLSEDGHNGAVTEPLFPSKTYFLMAVDNEIIRNIGDQDVGLLLGVKDIKSSDAEAIYYGMRKAMLKYAARAWDAGIVSSYGKDVGQVFGWHDPGAHSDPNEIRIVNKLLLFHYAQQYQSSNTLLQHYHQQLTQHTMQLPDNSVSQCKQHESYSDYIFYKQLGQLSANPNQLFPIAANYEALFSCDKVRVETMLSATSESISKHDIASMITVVEQS
ncbi:hypothetical protein MAQ5080_01005 [Marinomonas aquimarina]|uniref:Uncharacterized protein n=1 Tax=Marinomonas aquimarina TaxID=295068 RepID=A0A1A8T783_9GAMM|nr:hypothetical protein [Marinomonas aquimarina]SBS28100.1 hypothetical protein MAQ5080_01005 [Marinomonas aquimarina]